eukprot:scaffold7039_cov118-Isochrysis_galbana.AAC.3
MESTFSRACQPNPAAGCYKTQPRFIGTLRSGGREPGGCTCHELPPSIEKRNWKAVSSGSPLSGGGGAFHHKWTPPTPSGTQVISRGAPGRCRCGSSACLALRARRRHLAWRLSGTLHPPEIRTR